MTTPAVRTLVAGVGNIFFGDDGFGVEVARRLAKRGVPDEVTVADHGVAGMHLACDLSEGFDKAIVIDATPRGGTPGAGARARERHRGEIRCVSAYQVR